MGTSGKHRTRSQPKNATTPRAAVHAAAVRHLLPPKLTPPNPTRLFPRARLFDLLDRTRQDHRVIWVSAPGGAGKTSLAVSYLSERGLPVLWYQVDAGDGDVASFFYYVGLAVRRAAPRYKKPLPVLSREYLADIPTFTRNFFREFYRRMPRNGAFVLDNYQDAPEDSLLHEVLHTAMSEVPEGINLIVLSRVEPPAVLARLRLCDHAACVDWGKMQLTPEETAGIGEVRLGSQLDIQTLHQLHERAHGWAAGVVLLLEQARGEDRFDAHQPLADQKLLFDYFAGEILHRSDRMVQTFLLMTALFPKVTADEAEALTGHVHARDILEDLTRRNYFTVRHAAPKETYYEYHPLFREFLLNELANRFAPGQLAKWRRETAGLLAAAGNIEAAVALHTQAQDWQGLVPVILQHAPNLAQHGRLQTLAGWLRPLPAPLLDAVPWLRYWLGVCTIGMDPQQAIAHFSVAYEGFDRDRDVTGVFLSWAGAADAIGYQMNNYRQYDLWLDRLDRLTEAHPEFPSLEIEARVLTGALIACAWARPAHPSLTRWLQRAVTVAQRCDDPVAGARLVFHWLVCTYWYGDNGPKVAEMLDFASGLIGRLADAPLEQIMMRHSELMFAQRTGDAERALRAMDDLLEISAHTGVHLFDAVALGMSAWACHYAGAPGRTDVLLQQMRERLEHSGTKLDRALYETVRAARAVAAGDLPAAQRHNAIALQLYEELPILPGISLALLTAGFCHLEQKETKATCAILARVDTLMRDTPPGNLWYMRDMVGAQLAFAVNDEAEGDERLGRSLKLARRMDFPNQLVFNSASFAKLCAMALERNIEPDAARALIRRFHLAPPDGAPSDTWPYPVKLQTLGHFSVLVSDEPLKFVGKSQKKPLELLKVLVALGGREVSEAKLAEALWPDVDGDTASQSLATTLHRLRKLIGEEAIARQEGRLSLDSRHAWVDVWTFERSLTELEQACQKNDADKLQALTTRLFTLYRGPFLKDEPEVPWVLALREKLRGKFLRHLEASAHCLAPSQPEQAMTCYEKALEIEPLAESLYRGLLQVHLDRGRRAEALTVYERCEKILNAQLGICPSPDTEALARKARGN